MAFFRLLHLRDWDEDMGRFSDVGFIHSGDGTGVSVVLKQCTEAAALETGDGVATRLAAYYPTFVPIVVWIIHETPDGVNIVDVPSDTGDECHKGLVFPGESKRKQREAALAFYRENAWPSPPLESSGEYWAVDGTSLVQVHNLEATVKSLGWTPS